VLQELAFCMLLIFVKQLKEITVITKQKKHNNDIIQNSDFEVRNVIHIPLSCIRLVIDIMQEFA